MACSEEQVLGSEGVYLGTEFIECDNTSSELQTFRHAYSLALAILPGNGKLSAELAFGGSKLAGTEGVVGDSAEFSVYETQTAPHVVRVAAEIGGPHAGVGVGSDGALHGIY